MSKQAEITIDFQTASKRMRRLLEQQRAIADDLAELMTQCRSSQINGALLKKWLKAELADGDAKKPKSLRKLIQDTEDQAVYGDALGHNIGILQNSQEIVSDPPHDPSTGEIIEPNGASPSGPLSAATPEVKAAIAPATNSNPEAGEPIAAEAHGTALERQGRASLKLRNGEPGIPERASQPASGSGRAGTPRGPADGSPLETEPATFLMAAAFEGSGLGDPGPVPDFLRRTAH